MMALNFLDALGANCLTQGGKVARTSLKAARCIEQPALGNEGLCFGAGNAFWQAQIVAARAPLRPCVAQGLTWSALRNGMHTGTVQMARWKWNARCGGQHTMRCGWTQWRVNDVASKPII